MKMYIVREKTISRFSNLFRSKLNSIFFHELSEESSYPTVKMGLIQLIYLHSSLSSIASEYLHLPNKGQNDKFLDYDKELNASCRVLDIALEMTSSTVAWVCLCAIVRSKNHKSGCLYSQLSRRTRKTPHQGRRLRGAALGEKTCHGTKKLGTNNIQCVCVWEHAEGWGTLAEKSLD